MTEIIPVGNKILAVQYEKPERTLGGLIIPEISRRDTTGQLWEVVRASRGAEEELGVALPAGSILKTRWGTGVSLDRLADDNRPLFVIDASRVFNVITYTQQEEK